MQFSSLSIAPEMEVPVKSRLSQKGQVVQGFIE